MRLFIPAAATALALTASGCAYNDPKGGAPMPLVNSAGQMVGSVVAWQTAGGVGMRITAAGLPHGIHGIHVHQTGACAGPDFKSAGGHWNPTARQHGISNPAGPHMGDMPNVTVAANGTLNATVTVASAQMVGAPGTPNVLMDADGAALVIHAKADDNMTDPSGNSGDRIACAALTPSVMRY